VEHSVAPIFTWNELDVNIRFALPGVSGSEGSFGESGRMGEESRESPEPIHGEVEGARLLALVIAEAFLPAEETGSPGSRPLPDD
jgi:hypothetical protein